MGVWAYRRVGVYGPRVASYWSHPSHKSHPFAASLPRSLFAAWIYRYVFAPIRPYADTPIRSPLVSLNLKPKSA